LTREARGDGLRGLECMGFVIGKGWRELRGASRLKPLLLRRGTAHPVLRWRDGAVGLPTE